MGYEVAPFGRFGVWGVILSGKPQAWSRRIWVGQDEGAMDVPFFALVSHDKTWLEAHIGEGLIEMPCHAEAGAPTHPRINVVLVAVIELAGASRTTGLFKADDFRQILVGDIRNLVAEINHLFHVFWSHWLGMSYDV